MVGPETVSVVGSQVWFSWVAGAPGAGCRAGIERLDLATGESVGEVPDAYARDLVPFDRGVYTLTMDAQDACAYRCALGGCSGGPTAPPPAPTTFDVRDRATGAVLWRAPYGSDGTGLPGSRVAIADGLIVTRAPVGLAAFAAGGCGAPTCQPTWTGGFFELSPLLGTDDGMFFAAGGDSFGFSWLGLDPRAPGSVMRIPTSTPTYATALATDDDSAYVIDRPIETAAGPTTVRAFTRTPCGDGLPACVPRWTGRVPDAADRHVVAGGVVYLGTGGGVYAFAADGCGQATCAPLAQVGSAPAGDLLVAGGRLYTAPTPSPRPATSRPTRCGDRDVTAVAT